MYLQADHRVISNTTKTCVTLQCTLKQRNDYINQTIFKITPTNVFTYHNGKKVKDKPIKIHLLKQCDKFSDQWLPIIRTALSIAFNGRS